MGDNETYWECESCQMENTSEDTECCSCGQERPATKFAHIKVGLVLGVEAIPKTQLRAVRVSVTKGASVDDEDDKNTLTIVTNAKNVDKAGLRVVVAMAGAVVPGSSGEMIEVSKASVGGRRSDGMLCDGSMLGWRGGSVGAAVLLGEDYAVGDEPPAEKPRAK